MKTFIDIPKNFIVSQKDIVIYTKEASILESIKNILDIELNTKLMDLEFGSQVKTMLFRPMTNSTAQLIINLVEEAIYDQEPRVEEVYTTVNYSDDDYINLDLTIFIADNKQIGFNNSYDLT